MRMKEIYFGFDVRPPNAKMSEPTDLADDARSKTQVSLQASFPKLVLRLTA